jgi:hypothetical protein
MRLKYNAWNASPPEDIDRVVRVMAHSEGRTLSNMILRLVMEALEMRNAKRDNLSNQNIGD